MVPGPGSVGGPAKPPERADSLTLPNLVPGEHQGSPFLSGFLVVTGPADPGLTGSNPRLAIGSWRAMTSTLLRRTARHGLSRTSDVVRSLRPFVRRRVCGNMEGLVQSGRSSKGAEHGKRARQAWVKWLAMAGQTLDAEQALAIGLVQAVYPASVFPDRAIEFAHQLAAMPREAIGVAKIAVDTAASVDRRSARDFDRFANTTLFMSQEHHDLVEGFQRRAAEHQIQRSGSEGGQA